MKCPDCREDLAIEATACRCGWKAAASAGPYAVAGAPKPVCRTVGCHQAAMLGFAHCAPCDERLRYEAAEARCRELGLTTLEAKKAYCRRMMKQGFEPPSFERWANHLTQAGVETLIRMGTKNDEQVLRRFRAIGVIDEHNRLIPLDKRAEVRAALEAVRRAEAERLDAILKAQGVVRREPEVQG